MIHCIGESHTLIFDGLKDFKRHTLWGITASHVKNRLNEIDDILKQVDKINDVILFVMGEIDCRVFLDTKLQFYLELNNETFESENKEIIITKLVDKYFNILKNRYSEYKICFWGPVASYREDLVSYHESLKKIFGDRDLKDILILDHPDPKFFMPGNFNNVQRNEITKIFNKKLESLCVENDIPFLTMFYDMIDENMMTKYDMTDGVIHLNDNLKPMVLEKFKKIINDMNKKLKICVMTMCYNEVEIMPFWLDYYVNKIKVDKIVFYDGGSTDGTKELIKSCSIAELIEQYHDRCDTRWGIDVQNNGWKKFKDDYDWIIVCDMDEFIYHPNLHEKLNEYYEKGVTIPLIEGFDMISMKFPNFKEGEYLPEIIKKGIKDSEYLNKKIIFNPKKVDINYHMGCHKCDPTGHVKYSEKEEIKLLQYKWLSYDYLTRKSKLKFERLSDWNIENRAGFHYKTYSEYELKDFIKRFNSSTNVVDYNIIFDADNYIGNEEELKIKRLEFLEYFMKNEQHVPYSQIVNFNEKNDMITSYYKFIHIDNYSDKAKNLIVHLKNIGYEEIDHYTFRKQKTKDIYIFSHNYLINNWKDILEEQLLKINISGLYKNTTKLFFCAFGEDEQFKIFENLIKDYDKNHKIEIKKFDDNFYEYYTLQHMWDFCQNIEESYVLYFHLKGVWSGKNLQINNNDEYDQTANRRNPIAIEKWRKCLEYFNIERWYKCIDKLNEGHETVGCLYNYNPDCPIYTGNFWWSNSNHIKNLERPIFNESEEPYNAKIWIRIKCEKWINSLKNNFFNFYSPRDYGVYYVPISEYEYRDDLNPLISILTPTYKRYDDLKKAIECILQQTYKNWEMLICSDGHDDKVQDIINYYNLNNIKYLNTEQTNDHGASQRNYLTEKANGKYILYLDDDNVIYPNHLQTVVDNMDSNTGMIIYKIDYDGLDHCLPIEDKIILGKIDTLNFVVDKYYTKNAIWNNYIEHDYEVIKICENNILNHNKNIKFIPNVLGRHIENKIFKKPKDERIMDLLNNTRMFYNPYADYGVNVLYGLYELIKQNVKDTTVVCEIGSFAGASSEMFALHCKEIYCVDSWIEYSEIAKDNIIEAEKRFDKMIKNYNNIHKIKMSSDIACNQFSDKYFDLIYIDASHDYYNVKKDILNWIPKVKKHGIISGHDYLEGNDVKKAVDEIFENSKIKVYQDSSWLIELNESDHLKEKEKCLNIVQIGANEGYDSLTDLVKENDFLLLVEPFKNFNESLKRCYSHIKNLYIENIVITDDVNLNEISFFSHRNSTTLWESSVSKEHILKHFPDENGVIVQNIKCKTINELLDSYGLVDIDILFIDAEGFDDKIIKSIDFNKYNINKIYYENIHVDINSLEKFLKIKNYKIHKNVCSLTDMAEKIDSGKFCYVMTSHPNFKMSEDITLRSIKSIKPNPVILSSHCPVSLEIQKEVDYFLYDKNNPLIRHDFFTQSWFDEKDYYALINLTKNDNNFNHAMGVYLNYFNSLIYAKSLGYEIAVCTNFDLVFDKKDIKIIEDKINQMEVEDKKAFFMNTSEREGEHFKTIFFITNIDYFLEKFKYVTNEKQYNEEMKRVGSNTNCLENFVFHSLKNNKNEILLQEISENDLFNHSEINLFSLIEYNTILPVENEPNCFVVWFSSANSLDSRDFEITIIKNNFTILFDKLSIDKRFIYHKKFNFEKDDIYEINFKTINNEEILKNKTIIVNNEIFSDINSYGRFVDKKN